MEIKRRLTKIANRLTPQIEVMNVGQEMQRMCQRFEELVAYAEEKIERAATRGKTIGAIVQDARAAADKEVLDQQTAESDENLKDQQESFDERNKVIAKTKKPEPGVVSDELAKETLESTIEGNAPDMPDMSKKPTHPKKTAKNKAKKKR